MQKANPRTAEPVRLNWAFYVLLGLATGPLIYSLQHGDGLAAVAYGALCALWYAYGLKARRLVMCLYALEALVLASEAMYRQLKGLPAPAAPPVDGAP